MLHGIHCTPSCCIKSTAFNRVPFLHTAGNTMHSIGMHFNTLHGLHCCIMDYTAAIMLHIIHCIPSGCIGLRCMDSTEYNRDPLRQNAWNTLHSLTLHGIHCIQSGCFGPCLINSTAFNDAAWNPPNLIGIHYTKLYRIHCIQSGCILPHCMEFTAFNHAARNPLHSIRMLWAMLHKIHCIQSCCT